MSNYPFENLTEYFPIEGTTRDRALVSAFLQTTYRELYPDRADFSHLEATVASYLSDLTPIWFVKHRHDSLGTNIGCLWIGIAIDQITGTRHPNIFLIYVDPAHRRRGIGSALMQQAEDWARSQGYPRIGLQVFTTNQPALQLYQKLGYQPHSISMIKTLR